MVPGSLVSNFVCCARYVEEAFEKWLKSDGDQWLVRKYLQKDLVDLKNSCMKVG
jgi:hypothetical protein